MQVNTVQGSESITKEDESGVRGRRLIGHIQPEKHASEILIQYRVASEKGRNGSCVAVEVRESYVSMSAK
jgi:hypothetical protein